MGSNELWPSGMRTYEGEPFRKVRTFIEEGEVYSIWAIEPYPDKEALGGDLFVAGFRECCGYIKNNGYEANKPFEVRCFRKLLFLIYDEGACE